MDSNKKWRSKNPAAYKAHMIVEYEIDCGRLIHQPCEKCGVKKTHAHHEDYSKPLDIIWLCSVCHRKLHAERAGQTLHEVGYGGYTKKPTYKPYHRRYQPAPKRDAMLSKAKELREKGLSYREIAQNLTISRGTAYKWLNDVMYS